MSDSRILDIMENMNHPKWEFLEELLIFFV